MEEVDDGGGEASDARRWTSREADVCYEDSREDGRRGRRKKMDRGEGFLFVCNLGTKIENDELASVQRHRPREKTKTSTEDEDIDIKRRQRHQQKTKTSSENKDEDETSNNCLNDNGVGIHRHQHRHRGTRLRFLSFSPVRMLLNRLSLRWPTRNFLGVLRWSIGRRFRRFNSKITTRPDEEKTRHFLHFLHLLDK